MSWKNPEDTKEYFKKYYQDNKARYIKNTNQRRLTSKLKAIEYLGGQCIKCGYEKCPAALEFHHRNPKEKEFNLKEKFWLSLEKLKVELDKCDLLCSNCHREEHWNNNRSDLTQVV